jgi:hypothetical protein
VVAHAHHLAEVIAFLAPLLPGRVGYRGEQLRVGGGGDAALGVDELREPADLVVAVRAPVRRLPRVVGLRAVAHAARTVEGGVGVDPGAAEAGGGAAYHAPERVVATARGGAATGERLRVERRQPARALRGGATRIEGALPGAGAAVALVLAPERAVADRRGHGLVGADLCCLSKRVARQDLLGQQFASHAARGRREPRCAGLDVGLGREAPTDVVDVAGVACLWRTRGVHRARDARLQAFAVGVVLEINKSDHIHPDTWMRRAG